MSKGPRDPLGLKGAVWADATAQTVIIVHVLDTYIPDAFPDHEPMVRYWTATFSKDGSPPTHPLCPDSMTWSKFRTTFQRTRRAPVECLHGIIGPDDRCNECAMPRSEALA